MNLVCGGGEDGHDDDGNGDNGDFCRGVGVIAYMLVSGGVSPFWAGNRYRTMAKVITLIFSMLAIVIIRIDIIIIVIFFVDKIKPR